MGESGFIQSSDRVNQASTEGTGTLGVGRGNFASQTRDDQSGG
jgi:hypothetical protein